MGVFLSGGKEVLPYEQFQNGIVQDHGRGLDAIDKPRAIETCSSDRR